MRPLLLIAVAAALAGIPTIAPAQSRLSVAVQIREDDDGGIVASAFRSALRQLGDVVVEERGPTTDFAIVGLVLCRDAGGGEDCSRATSYMIGFSLFEPIPKPLVREVIRRSDGDTTSLERLTRVWHDELSAVGYQKLLGYWVAHWEVGIYRQRIQQLVGMIDSQCFEKRRVEAQWEERMDRGEPADDLLAVLTEPDRWGC